MRALLPVLAGVLVPGVLLPNGGPSLLIATALAAVLVLAAAASLPVAATAPVRQRMLRAFGRIAARPSQSHPDARGHRRSRAPGALLTTA